MNPGLFVTDLKTQLLKERLGAYGRLSGGFPILLAGATYWGALAAAGHLAEPRLWYLIALFGSGAIFPLALLYAAIFRNNFMKDRTAVTSILAPAFISMLLFWPMAIAALWEAPSVFPLILAIGLSIHFPVIGWSYARTALLSAHAIIRAIVVFAVWWKLPDERLTTLPLCVMLIYLATALIVVIDAKGVRARNQ